jgi:hypothetical protein
MYFKFLWIPTHMYKKNQVSTNQYLAAGTRRDTSYHCCRIFPPITLKLRGKMYSTSMYSASVVDKTKNVAISLLELL